MSPRPRSARVPGVSAVREAVAMGLGALRAYKMRAALTILGVVMGIMTVTGMSAIVAGLNASMAAQIEGSWTFCDGRFRGCVPVLSVSPWAQGRPVFCKVH